MLYRDGHENLDHFRIEMAAGTGLDFFTRMRHRESPAIGPVANHGVERVGNSKDPCPQWNLLAFQASGITGAVIELLVGKHDFRGIAKKWDANQHVVTDFAGQAHDVLFIVGKWAGLSKNAIGNGQLA